MKKLYHFLVTSYKLRVTKVISLSAFCFLLSAFCIFNAQAQNSFPNDNVIVVEDSITHIITATVIGSGIIKPQGITTVPHGIDQSFEIAGAIGQSEIKHLWIDEEKDLNAEGLVHYFYTFTNVTADHTIVAEFENVGINENEHSNLFIYPNPTNEELRITNYELRMGDVEIFDIMGRMQNAECRMQNAEEEMVINISHLQAGIYFLKIDNQTIKIIKN